MAFKDLKKRLSGQDTIQEYKSLERLRNKPFWIWNIQEHKIEDVKTNGDCCFNHIIGLPTKNGQEKPLFDYQKILYDSLLDNDYPNIIGHTFKHKHLFVKKSTGLGVTEFFLRLMAWLCLGNDDFKNSQMCIVTGPNIDIAIKLIKRMKGLFEPKLGVRFDSKETVLELNGCTIEVYPSNHLDSYRALDNPKFILSDESDFYRKGEQEDVTHVSERYIAKSDPYIVMVSTPNGPGGLFESIEKEPEETCIYKRLFFDYTYGLGKIYTQEEIDKAKQSPSFDREYDLKYLGKIGNVFHTKDIEAAVEKGSIYDPEMAAVSYCNDCKNTAFAAGCVIVVDYKYIGYCEILDAIRDNKERAISFEEAVKRAFNRTENVSYNGSGAEPGVLMLKRYIGYHFRKDSKRLWEFRYKLQYEEPRVNVVNSSSDEDTLLLTWNKDYVQPERVVIDFV